MTTSMMASIHTASKVSLCSGESYRNGTNKYKGGYKTCWSVAVDSIDTKAAREIWDEYVAFSSHDDAKHSIVNFENYSHAKAHAVSQDENAVGPAIRTMKRHCFASTIYSDAALIQPAKAYGEKFRNLMTKSSDKHVVYVKEA